MSVRLRCVKNTTLIRFHARQWGAKYTLQQQSYSSVQKRVLLALIINSENVVGFVSYRRVRNTRCVRSRKFIGLVEVIIVVLLISLKCFADHGVLLSKLFVRSRAHYF